MRKIEEKMVTALRTGRALNVANTCVAKRQRVGDSYQQAVYLHGNEIARFEYNHAKTCEPVAINATLAGWGTVTTRSRLNAICREFTGAARFHQAKGVQHFDDAPIDECDIVAIR